MPKIPPPPPRGSQFDSEIWQKWFFLISQASNSISVGLAMPSQFSVTGSPVTGTGNFAVAWNVQSPDLVLASPASGTGIPTFRSLVAADLPKDISSSNVLTWLSF